MDSYVNGLIQKVAELQQKINQYDSGLFGSTPSSEAYHSELHQDDAGVIDRHSDVGSEGFQNSRAHEQATREATIDHTRSNESGDALFRGPS